MADKPVTMLFEFAHTDDRTRPMVMREFVANGYPNLVFSAGLIMQCMANPGLQKQLHKEAEETGITFVDSHAPGGPMLDLNVIRPKDRGLMLERLKSAMRLVADFDVKTITIHTGNGSLAYPGYELPQYKAAIIASLRELLPLAHELDLIICIENIWYETNTPEMLLDILHEVNDPNLGFCYDAGHANLISKDRGLKEGAAHRAFTERGYPIPFDDRILEKMLPHVVNCHLHDNNGIGDQHLPPGRGCMDWQHIIPLLKKAPMLQSFQSEVFPVRSQTPIATLCKIFTELMKIS